MRYGKRNQQECWFLFFVFKLVWLPENHIYSDKKTYSKQGEQGG